MTSLERTGSVDFFFLHIPKNAGRTIELTLRRLGLSTGWAGAADCAVPSGGVLIDHGPTAKAQLDALLPHRHDLEHPQGEWYARAFKFAVVRNPWDRAVSAWRDLLEWRHERLNVLTGAVTFRDGCAQLLQQHRAGLPLANNDPRFGRQSDLPLGEMNVLIRLENLSSEWSRVLRKLGVDEGELRPVPLFASVGRKEHLLDEFDPFTLAAIEEVYGADVTAFGYQRPS